MKISWLLVLSLILGLGGCAGLQQFPKISTSAEADLLRRDPDYLRVQARIEQAAGNAEKQKQFRNDEIDRRLRIIDLNFRDFETALAQQNVTADFGVSVVQIGVGVAGALVSETASQILSATSAGLAGTQAAYSKAALFNQALPALLAQMIASRKVILVEIYKGRTRSLEEYPLSTAVQDVEAYYFAGSLPGSVVATSADAKRKNDEAEDKLAQFRSSEFHEDDASKKISAFIWPGGDRKQPVNEGNLQQLREWLKSTGVSELPIQKFLDNKALRPLRERAIREIPIP